MSFTDHPTADEIIIRHPLDGPVSKTVFTWCERELASVQMCSSGYMVSTGKHHPEPNHCVWVGHSWENAMRLGRQYAEMAAMMIAENRPGWSGAAR